MDCGKGLKFTRPSLVKIQFVDDCDINIIVKRFIKTGELPNLSMRSPLAIQDASMLPEDFQEMAQQRVEAVRIFESESVELREFFNHDAEKYFEWRALSDDDKIKFLQENASPALCKKLIKSDSAPAPASVVEGGDI